MGTDAIQRTAPRTKRSAWRGGRNGQSIVEFALVLPLLLLFLMGMTEVGFAMYSYLRLAGANREGARLASRGRFEDTTVAEHLVAAGGLREIEPGVQEPHLRTTGIDPNTGIIITTIQIELGAAGLNFEPTYYLSGTITTDPDVGPVPVDLSDSRLSQMTSDELLSYLNYRRSISDEIHEYRESVDFEASDVETFVIVETFYDHETLTRYLPFLGDTIQLSFDSTLRMLEDSRLD